MAAHTYTTEDDARIRAAFALPWRTKERIVAIKALARSLGVTDGPLRSRAHVLRLRDGGKPQRSHSVERSARVKPKPLRKAVLPVIERPAWMGEQITMQRLMAGR